MAKQILNKQGDQKVDNVPTGFGDGAGCPGTELGVGRLTFPVKGMGWIVGTGLVWPGAGVGCGQTSTRQQESLGSVFIVQPGVTLVTVGHLKNK